MSDGDGRTPDEPVLPEAVGEPDATAPTDSAALRPADDVIPPPPPDTPVPEGLLAPPPADIPPADAVLPPPPPATRRSERERPTPAILEGEPPAAVADDWTQPSMAPEVPTGGGYRVLAGVIFAFLFLLLVAAVVTLVFLVNAGFPTLAVGVPVLPPLRV